MMTAATEPQRSIFSRDLERTFQNVRRTPEVDSVSLRGHVPAARRGPRLRRPLPIKRTVSRSQQLLVLAVGAGLTGIAGLFAYELITKIIAALAPAPFLI